MKYFILPAKQTMWPSIIGIKALDLLTICLLIFTKITLKICFKDFFIEF